MTQETISLAKDFSKYPAGRFEKNGPYTGEGFRRKFLVPLLKRNAKAKIKIVLDGTLGLGSSFLEEAFGGLVRIEGFSAAELKDRFEIISLEDTSLVDEIWRYIKNAKPGSQ